MKRIKTLCGILALSAAALSGCGVNDTTPGTTPTVQSHFFPFNNGIVYTYGRYTQSSNDTLRCQMIVGQLSNKRSELINLATDSLFYYIGLGQDANGNQAAMLGTDSSTLLALAGPLMPGDTWSADPAHGITATVVEHFDDYFLPGRSVDFSDVLAIKYHQAGQSDNVYTLRYFARDHGLILERQMVGPTTEIASLQLLTISSPNANGIGTGKRLEDHHFSQSYIYKIPEW